MVYEEASAATYENINIQRLIIFDIQSKNNYKFKVKMRNYLK